MSPQTQPREKQRCRHRSWVTHKFRRKDEPGIGFTDRRVILLWDRVHVVNTVPIVIAQITHRYDVLFVSKQGESTKPGQGWIASRAVGSLISEFLEQFCPRFKVHIAPG